MFKALDYLYSVRVVKVSPGKEVFKYDNNGSPEKVKDPEDIWNYLLYVPEQIEAILRRS